MRAQTTLDFAIGMSIFLLTVAFVVSFVPGMFQPFEQGGGSEIVTADRAANQLSRQLLITGAEPFVLDVPCTTAFFDLGNPAPAECHFDGTTLHDRLGVADDANVNVQLVGEDANNDGSRDLLCNDGSGHVDESSEVSCATTFEAGSTPPDETNSVVVARRVVSMQGRDATLLVRMW